jgi:hypothetical protein
MELEFIESSLFITSMKSDGTLCSCFFNGGNRAERGCYNACISEMLGSNLDRRTGYSVFRGFPQFLHKTPIRP